VWVPWRASSFISSHRSFRISSIASSLIVSHAFAVTYSFFFLSCIHSGGCGFAGWHPRFAPHFIPSFLPIDHSFPIASSLILSQIATCSLFQSQINVFLSGAVEMWVRKLRDTGLRPRFPHSFFPLIAPSFFFHHFRNTV
jgi:hypothetical protein